MYTDAFKTILDVLISENSGIWEITFLSLSVSFWATFFAAILAIPFGVFISVKDFKGKKLLVSTFNTLLSVPTVVIGLFIYGLISRRGLLGDFGLLYTKKAMILGQTVLIIPIIVSFVYGAIEALDKKIIKNAQALGAGSSRIYALLVVEAKIGIFLALVAAFGRAVSEVGISMMLGGNIDGFSRNITTAIALEHNKGNFALGLALGIILLTVTFSINFTLNYFKKLNIND